jgi:eukaryotic-like serine/threonine-protein kinase
MTQLEAGHVIAGRFRLEQKLGQGGMGSVWSAEHLQLRSKVAVKLIVPRYADDPGMLSRFVREARAAAGLRSPHVVQILDSGIDEGRAFIVMELLEGETLAQRLERDGRLSPSQTANLLTQVARAVTRAHEANLVHRDLKPENIFLVTNEEETVVKVLDFGIAKQVTGDEAEPPSTRTDTGRLMGSPYYMSPEQARGREVDLRADLWALGVVAYECLLGKRPFRGESLGEVILAICSEPLPVPSEQGEVPPGFDAWFAKATARSPSERFASARELSATLRDTLSPGTSTSEPPGTTSGELRKSDARSNRTPATGSTTTDPTSTEARRVAPGRFPIWLGVAAVSGAAALIAVLFGVGRASRTPAAEPSAAQEPAPHAASPGSIAATPPAPSSTPPMDSGAPAASAAPPLPALPVAAKTTPAKPLPSKAKVAQPKASAAPVAPPARDPLGSRF